MAGSKLGYDYDFVDSPPKSLECPICLLTLRNPHVISCCGNEFCQACIERVQSNGKPCPLCNEPSFTTLLHKKLVREVNALSVHCPNKDLGCEWVGELGQLEKHLNIGSSSGGCGYVMVDCIYECGARVLRREVEAHEKDGCPKRPVELQFSSLIQKVEAMALELKSLSDENKSLRQELNEVKEKNSHLEKTQENLQKICDDLKDKQGSLNLATGDQKELHVELHGKESELSTRIDELEKKCESLHTHKAPLPLPPFYFSVRNIDELQQNKHTYRSEPFYSHPGGYKMFVAVYPNSKATHLSVYVTICRGEFDDQLSWPFDGKITVQAFNRTTEEWSKDYTIVMNEKESASSVKRLVNILADKGCGKPDYLSMSELKEYSKHANVIRFRVAKVDVFS